MQRRRGSEEADAFTVVMDDAARPRPGALQKRREEEALEKLKKTLADAAESNDGNDSNPPPVVSVGALAGPGGALSGVDFKQPPSFVVVDQIDGVPERIFAVSGPDFTRTLDESTLPENVEVYTR